MISRTARFNTQIRIPNLKEKLTMNSPQRNASIVVGASSGIGKATALHLAQTGNRVVAIARNPEALAECARVAGTRFEPLARDITADDAQSNLQVFLRDHNYAVKNLVYAAGVVKPIQPLLRSETSDLERHFATHVTGFLTLLRACESFWHNPARVIVVNSDSATTARAGWGLYCTSKAALEMACRVLQLELRESGVALACVKPGPVSTSIVDAALSADPADFPDREVFVHAKETGTLADPDQIAEFLAQLLENVAWDEFASRDWDYRTDR